MKHSARKLDFEVYDQYNAGVLRKLLHIGVW